MGDSLVHRAARCETAYSRWVYYSEVESRLLQWLYLPFSYNIHTVWKGYEAPLHPGAARYTGKWVT